MVLADASHGHAVLPAFVLGLVMSRHYREHREEQKRLRVVAFAFLTPFFFIRGGLNVSLGAVFANLGLLAALLLAKMAPKIAFVLPLARRAAPRHAAFTTLLMSTGLTFGTISALYGLNAGIIDETQLLAWAREHGSVCRAGVEGTGSFGAGLARFLADQGVRVVEVTRPSRRGRRHLGKSDTVDAEAAARMVLSGEATATPKRRDGIVESIRVLQIARRSAIKARTQAGQQIRSLIVTAPTELNGPLAALSVKRQVERCARLRPGAHAGAAASTQRALRSLGRRWQQLDREVRELERELHALIRTAAPSLLAEPGVGPDTAGKLLVIASDNVERLRSDAAFAALCGVSPIEASSGKTRRHRLNKGGDRQGNNALWTIANNRLIHHPETRAYAARRTAEGLSRREILRCLKRHLARRLYRLIVADLTAAAALDLT